jgi:hypothetical protein
MDLEFDITRFQDKLTAAARASVTRFGSGSALKNSVQVITRETPDGAKIFISFNNYGLYIDAGVVGANGGNASGRGYFGTTYRYKRVFGVKSKSLVPVGGDLPFGARVKIRKFGIAAKPWIQKMVDSVSEELVKDIELTLPPIIEERIVSLLAQLK